MKSAYELLCKMGNTPIEYGLWDKQNNRPLKGDELWKVNGTPDIEKRCIVMKPEQVWKNKLGTCWDCTLMEWQELKKMGHKFVKCAYFECRKANKEIGTTHSFVYYQENNSKDFWWFEYTWYKVCGLHGPFIKEDDLFAAVERAQKACDPADWKISYWNKDFDPKPLLDMEEIGIMDFVEAVGGS